MRVYSLETLRETKFDCYWQLVYIYQVSTRGVTWISSDKFKPDTTYGYVRQLQSQNHFVRLRHEGV